MDRKEQVAVIKNLIDLRNRGRHQEMLGKVVQIPVGKYTLPAVLRRELQSAFKHFPLVAGHSSHVKEPGSYLLSDWDNFPYVIVRGKDGILRGFLNTCRHRGARFVFGDKSHLRSFICPFHGWVYDLDGSLKSVSRPHDFPGIDPEKHKLKQLPVVENGGLVWIHPTPEAEMDISAALGPFASDLSYFKIDELISFKKSILVKKANWKLLLKTYLEGYHVPYLHRNTLQKSFINGVLSYSEHGSHIRLCAARSNLNDALTVEIEKWNILDYASVYYVLFPNTFFILHPDYVSINAFYPLAPEETIWTHEMLYREDQFVGEEGRAALEKRFTYTNDVVFDGEDFAVAESVQKGILAGANEFHTLGLEEGLLAIFQKSVDEAVQYAV